MVLLILQLLNNENFTLFSYALRACFLLFENCRGELKLQLEMFMSQVIEMVSVENVSWVPYDRREMALECIVQVLAEEGLWVFSDLSPYNCYYYHIPFPGLCSR